MRRTLAIFPRMALFGLFAAFSYALARSLGAQNAEVVGHDIGLMVAYVYAAH
jgi:pimeloyl-ACP methyl ester carboxylesterase